MYIICYIVNNIKYCYVQVERSVEVNKTVCRVAGGDFKRCERIPRIRRPFVWDVRGRRIDIIGRSIYHQTRLRRPYLRNRGGSFRVLVVKFLGASSDVSKVYTYIIYKRARSPNNTIQHEIYTYVY